MKAVELDEAEQAELRHSQEDADDLAGADDPVEDEAAGLCVRAEGGEPADEREQQRQRADPEGDQDDGLGVLAVVLQAVASATAPNREITSSGWVKM